MAKKALRLGFLASHNGTDMKGVVAALRNGQLRGSAEVVVSNNADAGALLFALQNNIPAFHINTQTHGSVQAVDEAICRVLTEHQVNCVILSGYMKMVGSRTCQTFGDQIWNVHPALLPKYAGLWGDAVHEAVLAAGEKETGVTIHTIVAGEYDKGRILFQAPVPILANDTVETLRARVQQQEIAAFIDLLSR